MLYFLSLTVQTLALKMRIKLKKDTFKFENKKDTQSQVTEYSTGHTETTKRAELPHNEFPDVNTKGLKLDGNRKRDCDCDKVVSPDTL